MVSAMLGSRRKSPVRELAAISLSRVGISEPALVETRDICWAKNLSVTRQSSCASQVSVHPAALVVCWNECG